MRTVGLALAILTVCAAPAMAQTPTMKHTTTTPSADTKDLGEALSKMFGGDDKGSATSGTSGTSFSSLLNGLVSSKKDPAASAPTTNLEGIARADDANILEITKADGSVVKVRQWGIEAPETKQWPWGPRARGELDRLLAASGGKVKCTTDGTMTKSGNLLARCSAGTADLSGALIEGGYGVEWREVSGGAYTQLEATAKTQKRGVWSGQ